MHSDVCVQGTHMPLGKLSLRGKIQTTSFTISFLYNKEIQLLHCRKGNQKGRGVFCAHLIQNHRMAWVGKDLQAVLSFAFIAKSIFRRQNKLFSEAYPEWPTPP